MKNEVDRGNPDRTPLRRARATEARRHSHFERAIRELALDKELGLTDEDVAYLLNGYRELADKPMFNLVSEQGEDYTPDLAPKCVPFMIGRGDRTRVAQPGSTTPARDTDPAAPLPV